MTSFCAQTLCNEFQILVETLCRENHPAVHRLLPFYDERYITEVRNAWATLDCIRQELSGLQSSLQNLTTLFVAQQQQLYHPSRCSQFSLHTVPSSRHHVVPGTEPAAAPPKKKASKPRTKKKDASQIQPESVLTLPVTPLLQQQEPSCSDNEINLEHLVQEFCSIPYSPVTPAFDLDNLI